MISPGLGTLGLGTLGLGTPGLGAPGLVTPVLGTPGLGTPRLSIPSLGSVYQKSWLWVPSVWEPCLGLGTPVLVPLSEYPHLYTPIWIPRVCIPSKQSWCIIFFLI